MQLLAQKSAITSLELVEQINIFRREEHERKPNDRLLANIAHKELLSVIRSEFEEEIDGGNLTPVEYNKMELQKNESEQKFSSNYLVEQINLFRQIEGQEVILLHKNFIAKIEGEFQEEIGELKIKPTTYTDKSNRESKCYELNFEQSLQILMSESKIVRKKCIEVIKEQQVKIQSLKNTPPTTYIEALEALLESEKQKLLLTTQVDNLSTALDSLLEWVSIIKVCTHNKINEKTFDWRKLKQTASTLGYEIKKAQSQRFGYQNLYHINVFKSCYPQFNYKF